MCALLEKKSNKMNTGKLIKELRVKKGLTQEQLAAKTELSARTIQRIENGEVDPRSYSLQMIADALEVDFSIFTEDNSKKDSGINSTNNNSWLSLIHLSGILPLIFPILIIWNRKKDKTTEMAQHFKAALSLQLLILGMSIGSFWVIYKTGIYTPLYGSLLVGALISIMNALRAIDGKTFFNPFIAKKNS